MNKDYIAIVYGTLGRKFIKWLSKYCDILQVNKVCDIAIRYGCYFDHNRYSDEKIVKNLKYSRPYLIKFTLNDNFITASLLTNHSFKELISSQWKAHVSDGISARINQRARYKCNVNHYVDLWIGIATWEFSHLKTLFPHDIIYYHDRKKGVENGNMD